MSSTESKPKTKIEVIEGLKKTLVFRDMEDKRNALNQTETDALIELMAETEVPTYGGALAKVFRSHTVMAVGSMVTIYPLPFSFAYSEGESQQKNIANFYGYFAVVAGSSLRGAQVYFIERSALELAKAVEIFSKLKLLS